MVSGMLAPQHPSKYVNEVDCVQKNWWMRLYLDCDAESRLYSCGGWWLPPIFVEWMTEAVRASRAPSLFSSLSVADLIYVVSFSLGFMLVQKSFLPSHYCLYDVMDFLQGTFLMVEPLHCKLVTLKTFSDLWRAQEVCALMVLCCFVLCSLDLAALLGDKCIVKGGSWHLWWCDLRRSDETPLWFLPSTCHLCVLHASRF